MQNCNTSLRRSAPGHRAKIATGRGPGGVSSMELCANCGAELPDDGLCAACLLAGGLGATVKTLPGMTPEPDAQHAVEHDGFGPYRILRMIGEGGMGVVYLAEQTDPIHRQVALKVVKPGMDTRQILSRFNYERQALAMMDHPNIARVYDASATEKGRPYFVMEYIQGIAITAYCDEKRLNTQQRLALFVPVCQAVQHAHQKGVIHRDLKPSNVLVVEQDGHPVPKVIDFGIARATDQRAVENTMLTQFGQFVGTPEYISPEQADVVTNDVDTSSDVYSLGVLLYELLVGAVPFDGASLRKAGLAELLRIIREEEVPPMPSKLTQMGETASEVAAQRSTDPVSLKRQLAGDLNWIVMKAVEKNRQRRYLAVAELAADIRRHMEHQPVLASPPSAVYRMRKFVRRHRLPALAAAAVLAAMIAGLGATQWEASVARRERGIALVQRADAVTQKATAEARSREAAAERARAEAQAANATRQQGEAERQRARAEARLNDVSTLANSLLFDLNDQVKDLPGSTKARESMTRLGLEYLNKLSRETEGNRQLQRQLAGAFLRFGELQGSPGQASLWDQKGARESYARSISLLEPLVQANPRDLELRQNLAKAYLGSAESQETAAERKTGYERAKPFAEKLAQDEPDNLEAQGILAGVLQGMTAAELRWSCFDCQKREPGEVLRAVSIRERMLAAHPDSRQARWELLRSQIVVGEYFLFDENTRALDWSRKALAGIETMLREEPANLQYQRDQARDLVDIGWGSLMLGRVDEALANVRQGIAIQERVAALDPHNASFRWELSDYEWALSRTLGQKGDAAGMLESLNKTLALQQEQAAQQPGNTDLQLWGGRTQGAVARNLSRRGERKGALAHQREAESIYRKLVQQYPQEKKFVRALAKQLGSVGVAMAADGGENEATAVYREGVALSEPLCIAKGANAEDCLSAAGAHSNLSAGYEALGRSEEAIAERRAAVEAYERSTALDPKSWNSRRELSAAYCELARLYEARSDWKLALEMALKAMPFLEADYRAKPGGTDTTTNLWNGLYYLWGEYNNLG